MRLWRHLKPGCSDHPIDVLDLDGAAARLRVEVSSINPQPEANARARDGFVRQLAEATALDLGSSGP
jgi:hypothetical protein